MNNGVDTILVILILTNLMLLGSSRLGVCIRVAALQGIVLGCLPLLMLAGGETIHLIFFAVVVIGLKGGVFPYLLSRTLRDLNVRREVEPFVGYGTSIILGPLVLAGCFHLGSQLPLPGMAVSSLIVPVAMFTIMTGLFLIISRRKALTQVLGYLVMENGISIFGISLLEQQPFLVEVGILLDVFVAVFVMGITIFHINREFDHIDTDQLSALRN
jgi:hydrogenase-4 component E